MNFLLILITNSISIANGNAYFQHLGWVSPAPSYGHIHMIVNIDTIEKQIKNVQTSIELINKTIEKRRASAFFRKATTELSKINIDFESFKQMIEETPENIQSNKMEHLILDQGCKILTKNHILFAGQTVTQEEKIHMWPIS